METLHNKSSQLPASGRISVLRPDFESDWGTDTPLSIRHLRWRKLVTYQRTPTGSAFLLPNDAGYERVFGVTQVQTRRSLPHWRAYNGTALLGLDPNRSYLLSDIPRDLSQVHINSLPPGVSVTETRVTENAGPLSTGGKLMFHSKSICCRNSIW